MITISAGVLYSEIRRKSHLRVRLVVHLVEANYKKDNILSIINIVLDVLSNMSKIIGVIIVAIIATATMKSVQNVTKSII